MTVADALVVKHAVAARAVLLDESLDAIATVMLTGGEVTRDRSSAIRSSGRFTLGDPDRDLLPYVPGGLFQLGRSFRIEMGVGVSDLAWTPVAVLLPDEPETAARSWQVGVSGRDRLALADRSDLFDPITYWSGTPVAEVVRAFAQAAGMGTADALYDLDDGGKVLVVDSTWEAERNRLDVMRQLAIDSALDLYVSPTGVLTLAPMVDPNTAIPVRTFGTDARTLGVTRRWRDAVFNHVIVVGSEGVRAEAAVTDPASPLHRDRIGDRVYYHRSDDIGYADQAVDLAAALLPQVALIEEELELDLAPDPTLNVGDVIEVNEPDTGTTGRFLVDYYPLPLAPTETARITVRRVLPVTA